MAELDTVPLVDLVCVEKTKCRPEHVIPGSMVHHKEDPNSFGTVMSRRWGKPGEPMQCEVLWSRQPQIVKINVQSTPIQAQSRKLNVRWSPQEADDLISGGFVSKAFIRKELFEVEEEYEHLGYDEVKKFHEEGADVQLHSDGRVVVRRKTDEPPQDFGNDDRIRQSRVTKRW